MVRTHGRATCCQHLVASAPYGHWNTSTFIAALREGGLIAPAAFKGGARSTAGPSSPMSSRRCCLLCGPDDIVIIDNLGSHEVAGMRKAIETAGARLLLLPPYGSDMNPIEQVFAELKAALRAKAIRTVDALRKALADIADAISPTECANDRRHAGHLQSA
jgi:transposase